MKKMVICFLMAFVSLTTLVSNSSAEEWSLSVVPIHGVYMPRRPSWSAEEEKAVFQIFVHGQDLLANRQTNISLEIQVLKDGLVWKTSNLPVPVEVTGSEFLRAAYFSWENIPNKYTIKASLKDVNSNILVSEETAFEIQDISDFRILCLGFYDARNNDTPPVFFKQEGIFLAGMLSSASDRSDECNLRVTSKDDPEKVYADLDFVNDGYPFRVSLRIYEPGKHVLLVKAVDKTKNLEVEYEIPVFVVDADEILK